MIDVISPCRLNSSRWLIKTTEEWVSLLACVSSTRVEPAKLGNPKFLSRTFPLSANEPHHFTFYMLVLANLIITASQSANANATARFPLSFLRVALRNFLQIGVYFSGINGWNSFPWWFQRSKLQTPLQVEKRIVYSPTHSRSKIILISEARSC